MQSLICAKNKFCNVLSKPGLNPGVCEIKQSWINICKTELPNQVTKTVPGLL